MNKAAQKKAVERLVNKYQKLLLLNNWTIDVKVSKELQVDNASARVTYNNPDYKMVCIEIYQAAFMQPNSLEHIIVHELCHCLTEKIYLIAHNFLNGHFRTPDEINERREELTEHIAKIIGNMNDRG